MFQECCIYFSARENKNFSFVSEEKVLQNCFVFPVRRLKSGLISTSAYDFLHLLGFEFYRGERIGDTCFSIFDD